ncbi:MAG: hypothetical protein EOM92_05650 [Gammaproteobacteria bacterium]|jgi:hypothetical protein|nr:hypothetical protein [Gammaproteobacteria bacterium]
MQHRERAETQRCWLAAEAARLMAEQGIAEPERARRKVAERAGITDKRHWPSNEEIQEALLAYRRLFWRPDQAAAVDKQRQQALAAMRHFHRFRPRLTGTLATDYPDPSQPVRLLLGAETVDEVVVELLNQGIRWRERQEARRFADGSRGFLPILSFMAGDTQIELLVLPRTARSNPPLDPLDERPERGLDDSAVTRLASLETGQIHPDQ